MASLRDRAAKVLASGSENPPPRPVDSEKKACQAWKRLILAVLMLFRNTRQEMLMEYLTQRIPEPEEVPALENKRKKNKGLDPEAKLRMGIGKPLSRSVAQKECTYKIEDCSHDSDYLRHRAGRGHFWFTCLVCGARWERLETSLPSSSSTSLVVEAPKGRQSKQAYPKQIPPPRYRQDLQGQNLDVQVKFEGSMKQLPIAPRRRSKSQSRSMESMSGLVPLQAGPKTKATSPTSPMTSEPTERYQLNTEEESPISIPPSEWEEAMMAYEDIKTQQVEAVHGPAWSRKEYEDMHNP